MQVLPPGSPPHGDVRTELSVEETFRLTRQLVLPLHVLFILSLLLLLASHLLPLDIARAPAALSPPLHP